MSLKPHRPAPLPPAKHQSGYKTFESSFNSDTNNNKAASNNAFSRPTVIRPSDNQKVKKKPPPRPAPPKNLLIRKNAIKRSNSSVVRNTYSTSSRASVVSAPPDLLADLHDIFGPPKQKSYPSPVSSRPAVKKCRAPQPQHWQKPSNEGPLIDFDVPPPVIHQSSSTPSFRAGESKTLLDEDLPNFFTSTNSSNSLQDLITIRTNTSLDDPFDSVFHNAKKVATTQQDPFGNSNFTNSARAVTTRHGSFGSIFNNAHAATSKTDIFENAFHSDIKWDSASALANTTSTGAFADEPWNIDQVASPPEPQHPPPPPPPPEACLSMEKWCRALYDFAAQSPDELTFSVGDIIFVDEEVCANWWKGHLNGKTGVFPSNYVEEIEGDSTVSAAFTDTGTKIRLSDTGPSNSSSCYAKAVYEFVAEQDGDLSFQEGDVIQVLYRINQDWLYGKFQNKEGQFPSNFVKKLLQEEVENKTEVVAHYSFKGEKEDELTFEEGDVIVVIENVNSDWSKGWVKKDGTCTVGHFPIAFTSPTGICS